MRRRGGRVQHEARVQQRRGERASVMFANVLSLHSSYSKKWDCTVLSRMFMSHQ